MNSILKATFLCTATALASVAQRGGESYWATQVGREFFASNAGRTADFVRARLSV